jgi:hypothetical protein
VSSPKQPTNPAADSPEGGPGFTVGQRVRVLPGTVDPDYPDAALGGWVGHVREIDATSQPPLLLVAWTRETLTAIHPAYRVRCERDDLDLDEMWLAESTLEPFPEGLAPSQASPQLEAPTRLEPVPLDLSKPEDRLRSIFGLTSDDPLPPPDREHLRSFRRQLLQEIRLPLPALLPAVKGSEPVLVTRIRRPENEIPAILAEATIGEKLYYFELSLLECGPNEPITRFIEDYRVWLGGSSENEPDLGSRRLLIRALPRYAGLAFGVAGALLATLEESRRIAWMAGAGLALAGGLWACWNYRRGGSWEPGGPGPLFVFSLGGVGGGLLGVLLGTLAAAYLGTIPGAILGTLTGLVLDRRSSGESKWTILGGLGGGMVLALWTDVLMAVLGFVLGFAPGLVIGYVLRVIFMSMAVTSTTPEQSGGEADS